MRERTPTNNTAMIVVAWMVIAASLSGCSALMAILTRNAMKATRMILTGMLVALLLGSAEISAAAEAPTDKTLVAWVTLDNMTQRGGSVLTIQSAEKFDAIVFGERKQGSWMAGSNGLQEIKK